VLLINFLSLLLFSSKVVRDFSAVADTILDDSLLINDLLPSEDDNDIFDNWSPRTLMAESMSSRYECVTSQYGSFPSVGPNTGPGAPGGGANKRVGDRQQPSDNDDNRRVQPMVRKGEMDCVKVLPRLLTILSLSFLQPSFMDKNYDTPFATDQYKNRVRRWAGRLGLDFVVAVIKTMNRQLDVALEGVIGATMSSTGFVTFLDLSATTCAASAPLTVKTAALEASVAPEPREIRWQNAHVSKQTQQNRELISNIVLIVGGVFWSFPLTAIQAFAKAKYLVSYADLLWPELDGMSLFALTFPS